MHTKFYKTLRNAIKYTLNFGFLRLIIYNNIYNFTFLSWDMTKVEEHHCLEVNTKIEVINIFTTCPNQNSYMFLYIWILTVLGRSVKLGVIWKIPFSLEHEIHVLFTIEWYKIILIRSGHPCHYNNILGFIKWFSCIFTTYCEIELLVQFWNDINFYITI